MRDVLLHSMLTLTKYLDLKLSSYQSSGILLDFVYFSIVCMQLSARCETKAPLSHKPQREKNERAQIKTENEEIIVIETQGINKNINKEFHQECMWPCIGKESLETDYSRKAYFLAKR